MKKQIYDLVADDLAAHPVWAWGGEENEDDDECTVAAVDPNTFDYETMYVAAATFTLADGTMWPGFIAPDNDLGVSQPCLFTPEGHMTLWSGIVAPERSMIEDWYSKLSKRANQIFPIDWRCSYAAAPAPGHGTILGFGFRRRDGQAEVVR